MPNPNPKTEQLKPFAKNYDPRRNMRGVPKDALAVKRRLEKIGAELLTIEEKIKDPETGELVKVTYDLTRFDAMLRLMYSSKAPADRKEILERVAGKVPQSVALTGADGGKVEIVVTYADKRDTSGTA